MALAALKRSSPEDAASAMFLRQRIAVPFISALMDLQKVGILRLRMHPAKHLWTTANSGFSAYE